MIDEALEKLQEQDELNEAMASSDARQRCKGLGKQFIEHFKKVSRDPKSDSAMHWISEMTAWYTDVRSIKLKNTKSPIEKCKLIDWFFHIENNLNLEESNRYKRFVDELLDCNDINQAFENIGIHIEKRI